MHGTSSPIKGLDGSRSITFLIGGNDNPDIVAFNLQRLNTLYADAHVLLYDWGYKPLQLRRFRSLFRQLDIVPWPCPQPIGNLREKIASLRDGFRRLNGMKIVYQDTDVIIMERIDEVYEVEGWDVGGTWRPEYDYGKSEYGIGAWLNDGVIFLNDQRPSQTQAFLDAWLRRFDTADRVSWMTDQAEFTRLFSEARPDLSTGPNMIGELELDGGVVRCRTLPYQVYNFLPEMYEPYPDYEEGRAKVVHLKSPWRRMKFRMLPGFLRPRWLAWVSSGYGGRHTLRTANLGLNRVIRGFWWLRTAAKKAPQRFLSLFAKV